MDKFMIPEMRRMALDFYEHRLQTIKVLGPEHGATVLLAELKMMERLAEIGMPRVIEAAISDRIASEKEKARAAEDALASAEAETEAAIRALHIRLAEAEAKTVAVRKELDLERLKLKAFERLEKDKDN